MLLQLLRITTPPTALRAFARAVVVEILISFRFLLILMLNLFSIHLAVVFFSVKVQMLSLLTYFSHFISLFNLS